MIGRALLLMVVASAVAADELPRCDQTLKFAQAEPPISSLTIEHMPEGTLVVEFTVDERGYASDPKVVESSNKRLDILALDSAVKWRFIPPRAKCRHRVPLTFRVK